MLLKYTDIVDLVLKDTLEDLSLLLTDVKKFVENWVGAQREVTPDISSNFARNLYALEAQLNKRFSISPADL